MSCKWNAEKGLYDDSGKYERDGYGRKQGGEMFVDRRSRSITKSTFERALQKLRENPGQIRGPKSLNVFGAPYVWALLTALGYAGQISGENAAEFRMRIPLETVNDRC